MNHTQSPRRFSVHMHIHMHAICNIMHYDVSVQYIIIEPCTLAVSYSPLTPTKLGMRRTHAPQ